MGQGLGEGIGSGSGSGAGYGMGTGKGKVGLIRLQYTGGDWDLNFGPGKDQNMLIQYAALTRQKTAEKTDAITPGELGQVKAERAPPLLIVGGQRTIILSKSEKRALRDYLLEKHGMILGDNGGSRQFHDHFFSLMNEATGVDPVPVPLDDLIHRSPFKVPFLPIVSPHGGTVMLRLEGGRPVGGPLSPRRLDGRLGRRPCRRQGRRLEGLLPARCQHHALCERGV